MISIITTISYMWECFEIGWTLKTVGVLCSFKIHEFQDFLELLCLNFDTCSVADPAVEDLGEAKLPPIRITTRTRHLDVIEDP